jgi:hypothetical protein
MSRAPYRVASPTPSSEIEDDSGCRICRSDIRSPTAEIRPLKQQVPRIYASLTILLYQPFTLGSSQAISGWGPQVLEIRHRATGVMCLLICAIAAGCSSNPARLDDVTIGSAVSARNETARSLEAMANVPLDRTAAVGLSRSPKPEATSSLPPRWAKEMRELPTVAWFSISPVCRFSRQQKPCSET